MENLKLNLNDIIFGDGWIHVFKRLSFKNRVLLERVSPEWKALMPYSDITSAYLNDFAVPPGKFFQEIYTDRTVDEKYMIQVLKAILNRAGQYLRLLDFRIENEGFVLMTEYAELIARKAPNLTTLNFNRAPVLTFGCVPFLAKLTKLEELRFAEKNMALFLEEDLGSSIQDKEVVKLALASAIMKLPELKKLVLPIDMEFCPLFLKSSYTELALGGRKMTPADMRLVVLGCHNLEALSFDALGNTVNLELGVLRGLKKLKSLALSSEILTDEEFAAICAGCPNLEVLHVDVTSCKNLHSCNDLWRLPKLKSLWVETYFALSPVDDSVLASVAKFGLLEDVNLPWAKLTDKGLKILAMTCPKLTKLCIKRIQTISDEGVKAVVEKCKNLEELDLTWTPISDATMGAIGAMGSSLRMVKAPYTKVTPNGIRWLCKRRRKKIAKGGGPLETLKFFITYPKGSTPIPKEQLARVNLIDGLAK